MNFINNHKNGLCGALSVAMILTAAPAVLAAETDAATTLAEATPAPTATPEATATPTAEPTQAPGEKNIDLGVTASIYTTDEKNVYKVTFKTDDALPNVSSLDFTATFSSGTINSVELGDALKSSGSVSKSITDDKTIKLSWKDGTVIYGSTVIFSVYVTSTSTLSEKNIAVDEFLAEDTDGTSYIITPELTCEKGVNMPTLSTTEQNAYNKLKALPNLSELSFYGDTDKKTICDINSKYKEPVDEALSSYNTLSSTGRKNVETALKIDGLSTSELDTLSGAIEAMEEVVGILELDKCYEGLSEDTALNYRYVYETFTNLSTNAPGELKYAPTAASEYSEALKSIDESNKIVEKKLTEKTEKTYEYYQTQISALKVQFDSAKNYSQIKLSKALLSSITLIADELYKDIEDNYTGSYKNYMLSDIEDITSSITDSDLVYKNLPTAEVPSEIRIGSTWTVAFTRKKPLYDQNAKIEVYIYNESGKQISTKSSTFPSGNSTSSINISLKQSESKGNETLTVKCYYVYNDISYLVESQSTEAKPPKSTNSGTSTGGSTGNSSGSNSSNGSGTLYPNFDDDATPTPTKAPSTADINPYSDIDSFDWAKEAIIGLTNAGIVNGMGDDEFNPTGNVTREQFCKMVVQLFGVSVNETDTDFADVDENAWYAPYITAAVQAGYVQGQSSEYFGVGEVIMRQDMATILYRATGFSGDEASLSFTDTDNIAAYAKDAVAELVGLGVMNGYSDGSFKPRGSATRAEAAKVIWGIYELL